MPEVDRGSNLIARRLLVLSSLVRRSANLVYEAEFGLSSLEWRLISLLRDSGPLTQTELAEYTLADPGQISRTATALTDKGLVERTPKTWRSLQLHLAPAGRELAIRLRKVALQRNAILTSGLSAAEIRHLIESLDKVTGNARTLLQVEAAKRTAKE